MPGPTCPHCHRSMQLNTAVSTEGMKQYICGCGGFITYHNEHKFAPPLELKSGKK